MKRILAFTGWRVSAPAMLLVGVLYISALAGCGSGASATVKGKVTRDGKPVTGGTLTFAPVAAKDATSTEAKPVTAEVQSDGTFEVKEAYAGRQRVLYSAPVIEWESPEWDGKGPEPKAPKSPFEGLTPKEAEVDVASGENDLTIELVPKKR